MTALKTRKKASKTVKKVVRKPPKKTLKLKSTRSPRSSSAIARRKPTQKPQPKRVERQHIERTIRLGPQHVDRHPIPARFVIHPPPPMHQMAMNHSVTVRHH